MLRLVVLFCLVAASLAAVGIDTTAPVSSSQVACLRSNNYGDFMARVWTRQGRVDQTGIQNIHTALNGGMTAFSFFEPCVSCSQSASQQIQAAYNAAQQSQIRLGGIFIKVLNSLGGWSSSTSRNVQYISQLIQATANVGSIPVIWSTVNDWTFITGNTRNFGGQIRYVVYSHLNGQANEQDWTQTEMFGGFPTPYMKEYATANVCQLSGFNTVRPGAFLDESEFAVNPVSQPEELAATLNE